MKENAITTGECASRTEQESFCAILKLEGATRLRLVVEDEREEVSAAPVDCKWNTQPEVVESNRKAYILACLPVLLALLYLGLTDLLHLW
jgi:hypothetical protein